MSKKRPVVAAVGEAATVIEPTPKLCVVCEKKVFKVLRCPKCESGMYCSDVCINNHKRIHKPLCSAIVDLENLEKQKFLRQNMSENVSKLPLKFDREIIRLVGEKPVIGVKLDEVECRCLMDTGSMVSIMSTEFLDKTFPGKRLYSVEEFLGGCSLSLSAANNTELPIEGVVLFHFGIEENLFQIPFVITTDELAHPIIGYNTIEHLVLNFENENKLFMRKMLPHLSADNAEVMVNIIEKASEVSEVLGILKTTEMIRVPGNCMVRVKGRTRAHVDCDEKEVMFSPQVEFTGENNVIVYESTGILKRGKSTHSLNVGIYNPTSQDVLLNKGTVLGAVLDISMVIRFPSSYEGKIEAKINSVEKGEDSESKSWFEQIDLTHLNDEQKKIVEKALREYEEVFSKGKNDIGFIPDFQMPINLTDNIPISEPYRQIPRLLYEEVKTHINNLLANGWIRQSQSSYCSPMVCVRKKD